MEVSTFTDDDMSQLAHGLNVVMLPEVDTLQMVCINIANTVRNVDTFIDVM
jgi:hypothetical protein